MYIIRQPVIKYYTIINLATEKKKTRCKRLFQNKKFRDLWLWYYEWYGDAPQKHFFIQDIRKRALTLESENYYGFCWIFKGIFSEFFYWDSLHARLKSHYEAWNYKKKI